MLTVGGGPKDYVSVTIVTTGASVAYVGVSSATTSTTTGVACPINVPVQIVVPAGTTLYAIAGAATTVSWFTSG
jgi:hypothetical protein